MATTYQFSPQRHRSEPGAVPFISQWSDAKPFSDIPANVGVTNAADMLEGWAATRQKALRDTQFEAEVGEWNTVPASLLELLSRYRHAVARIVVPGGQTDFRNIRSDSGWTGTGFLVAPNLLLTNNHVLNSMAVSGVAIAEFEYEWPSDKLFANATTTEPSTIRFELSPTRLFVTSPVEGGGLDYTFVWISEKAAEQFGTIRMERGSFMINQFEPTFVIHHPKGRLKEVSLDDTELLGVNSINLLYAADTDFGSSGACVFNRNGRLVALHHARQTGDTLKELYPNVAQHLSDGRRITVGNEGIKISAIAIDLESRMRRGGRDAENAAEILKHVEGSDTLTGVFGALGRQNTNGRDAERVKELYLGSSQDLDIGFWNLHWLLGSGQEFPKVEDAVTAIADLNQDLWCLTDVPPAAVTSIIRALHERFGEEFEAEFSEADAQSRQLATAVIWRRGTISCRRKEWPATMAGAWTRVVPELQNQGPIFQTPPGLFQIGSGEDEDRLVNIVPISLRKLRSDEVRRRLASRLLAHSIDLAIKEQNVADWLVGGDFEPPLAYRDSGPLQHRDYEQMAASDKGRGNAISYLRSPASGIRNILVTSDLSLIDNKREFFEVIQDRTVDRYVRKLAANRPAVLRLSLDVAGEAASDQQLDSILSATLASGDREKALPTLQRAEFQPPPHRESWFADLAWSGLDKLEFLEVNTSRIKRLIAEVAEKQRHEYPDLSAVTELDFWALTFAEAGIGRSGIDPGFRHSEGEIGLFPLPSNIAFWIGSQAPSWDQPMPIEINIESYVLYLGQIRNKVVANSGGRRLYRDLFCSSGIVGAEERQARLLAGIVHGYFVSRNYASRSVPFDHILRGFAADNSVDTILNGTGYVHAGSSILTNRQRNIDEAIAAYRRHS
jgi:hypothetical protein|nr:trypsin-like peptidase domain-containing protein [Neorhizobium tomejilense]